MNPRRVVTSGAPTLFTYIDLIGVPQARDGWSVFCPPEAIGGVGQGQGAEYATATRIEIRPIQLVITRADESLAYPDVSAFSRPRTTHALQPTTRK